MVERPIKRSERAERSDEEKRNDRPNKEKKGGRGKGRGDREERKPRVSPALMRGPKPSVQAAAPEVEAMEPSETENVSVAVESDGTATEITTETPTETAAQDEATQEPTAVEPVVDSLEPVAEEV
jgi:hypothetical protein